MQRNTILAKKKRTGSYNRNRGHNYETKVAKEIRELGYDGIVTSRSESKQMDNNKVDLIDTNGKLPCNIQLKKTIQTPNYFKIRSESTVDPESFCLIWAKQEPKEKNICTVGEAVIMDKQFFYKLLKFYLEKS